MADFQILRIISKAAFVILNSYCSCSDAAYLSLLILLSVVEFDLAMYWLQSFAYFCEDQNVSEHSHMMYA